MSTGLAAILVAPVAHAPASDTDETRPSFRQATAMRGCTQEDAPALELYFADVPFEGAGNPAPPYMRFEIGSSPGETIAASSLGLTGLRRGAGGVTRLVRAELFDSMTAHTWLSGTLALQEVRPGQDVAGRYDVRAPGGRHLAGSFVAKYVPRTALCG
jgi:hypothetical protein